jgi:hypothetical protein
MRVPLLLPLATIVLGVAFVSCGSNEEERSLDSPSPISVLPTAAATPTVISATPREEWPQYEGANADFVLEYPPHLTVAPEQSAQLTAGGQYPEVTMQILHFTTSSGVTALDLGVVPNPLNLTVQEWIDAYDPCAADYDRGLPQRYETTIKGQLAVVCPVDQLNQINPRVYVAAGEHIFVIVGNVEGLPSNNEPPGLTKADFDSVLNRFTFPK